MMKSRGIFKIKILILHASFRKDYKLESAKEPAMRMSYRQQHEPRANVSRQSHENTSSPAAVRNSPMQRQEPPLIDFDAEVTVPSVHNSGEPMQKSRARLRRDETGEQLIEIRERIVENRIIGKILIIEF